MPSTAVYFDALPPRIALMAASLMFSGVSKSGSPAPSPITSRPAALSARALSVTAMVADGLMTCIDSARNDTTGSPLVAQRGFKECAPPVVKPQEGNCKCQTRVAHVDRT